VARAARDRGDDRGDIVLGWLTRLTATLAVLGLIGFDGVSVVVGRLQAEDHANDAARAASGSWVETKDVQAAYDAALKALADDGASADTVDPNAFAVAQDGSVSLRVRHVSTTLVADRIAPLRSLAVSTATVTASPPPK
jgi:hypothetical protein